MSSASHQSMPAMRRPVTLSDYTSSSSSSEHGLRASPGSLPYPSPYRTDVLAAFVDVNKALGARTTRQSVAEKPRPAAHAPPPTMPPTEPLRPRRPQKLQTSSTRPTHVAGSNHPMMAGQERINPRFSTASAPAYSQWPAMSAQHELNSHGRYRRASASEEHMASHRPALRVTIPSSGQPSRQVHGRPKNTFADLGLKPAPLKDGSGCVIM
ncbi:hypothetical protein BDV93DRAFT_518547 [Ceratobasidium sp. AG-I]|nr:hypothetical protein BDV93DRAFT_518547 [Ceratobasidium sp. AG-I]